MCGIVGVLGQGEVSGAILDALRRLVYRGYDSAGIASLVDGRIERRRAPGKLSALAGVLADEPLGGRAGIGHTRWATHGAPNTTNAHPHTAPVDAPQVAVVHNGIIENFRELREELAAEGVAFASETDTEVVAHMIARALRAERNHDQAVSETLKRLEGAFALAILFGGDDGVLYGARRGSPLVVGHGDGEAYLGSDAIALAPFTNRICYLEDGDWVRLTREDIRVFDAEDRPANRPVSISAASAALIDKGNHRHFMAKEVHEQPEVIGHTLARYIDFAEGAVRLPEDVPFDFADLSRISISACGTAFYAGLVARYWFERFARLPVDIDIASEFRYREVPMEEGGLALFISQSGETADTLATLRYCREQGQHIACLVNVPESTIARESDVVFQTLAGPEIGVASTKAFTCQLAALAAIVIAAGRARGVLSAEDEAKLVDVLVEVPRHIAEILKDEPKIEALAKDLSRQKHAIYLGRSTNYPIALEGALKLKELSYIHAEGYAAGELKHGPIALIDEAMPVVVIAPYDQIFEKTASNMAEVAARGGNIILVTDEKGRDAAGDYASHVVTIPDAHSFVTPMLYAIPMQLLSYHTAVFLGTDVDQPRNLAKSVTVE